METRRRSASWAGTWVDAVVADGAGAAVERSQYASGAAHSPQNFAPGGFAVPQFGQARASGEAHSVQNLAPAGFSVRQLAQTSVTGCED